MASGGAASAGGTATGGAAAGDVERMKELFKKGLRIDGTHTRMSERETGDEYDIAGDGWCMYSSFLVAFERYHKYFSPNTPKEILQSEHRDKYRHAIAQQFARYIATEILTRPDKEELQKYICASIIQESNVENVMDEFKHKYEWSNVLPVSNKDGEIKDEYGYRLLDYADDSDTTWVTGYMNDMTEKYKFIPIHADIRDLIQIAPDAAKNTAQYMTDNCTAIDIPSYLHAIWAKKKDENSPQIFGDLNWFISISTILFPYLKYEYLMMVGEDTPAKRIDKRKEGNSLLIKKQSDAHFNSIVFEYIPAEIDIFPPNSPYLKEAKEYAEADLLGNNVKKSELIAKWEEEWRQALGMSARAVAGAASAIESVVSPRNLPPGATLGIQVMGAAPNPLGTPAAEPVTPAPAADDPIKEAAEAVADLMGAVAEAAEKLLGEGGEGGGAPASADPTAAAPAPASVKPAVADPTASAEPAAGGNEPAAAHASTTDVALAKLIADNQDILDFYDENAPSGTTPPKPASIPLLPINFDITTLPMPSTGPIEAKTLTDAEFRALLSSLPTPSPGINAILELTEKYNNLQEQIRALIALVIKESDNKTLLYYLDLISSYLIALTAVEIHYETLNKEKPTKEMLSTNNVLRIALNAKESEIRSIIRRRRAQGSGGAAGGATGASSLAGSGSQQPGSSSSSGDGGQPPSADDKGAILDRLAKLEAFIEGLPKSTDKTNLKGEVDALQAALTAQGATLTTLQADIAALRAQQEQFTAAQRAEFAELEKQLRQTLTLGERDRQAQIHALAQRMENMSVAVDAKALQTVVTTLKERVDALSSSAGGGATNLADRVAALEKTVGELSGKLGVPQGAPGAQGQADALAQMRTDIDQLKAQIGQAAASAAGASSAASQPVTSILEVLDGMTKRLDAIEGTSKSRKPLSLTEITKRIDDLYIHGSDALSRLTALEKSATKTKKKFTRVGERLDEQQEAIKEQQETIIGFKQALAALKATKDEIVAKQAATGVTEPIKRPPQSPLVATGKWLSWFSPGDPIAVDVSWFDQAVSAEHQNKRARDPKQQEYAKAMATFLTGPSPTQTSMFSWKKNPIVSSTYGTEETAHKEKHAAKIAADFPDRIVLIDDKLYTVRNPYATYKQRQDAAAGLFMSKTLPTEGGLRQNAEVLHAFAPVAAFGEYLADNRRAIAVLESLWHCGNQQSADADPKCFPARVIEELREYQQLKEAEAVRDMLKKMKEKRTGLSAVIHYLQILRDMLQKRQNATPLPAAMIPTELKKGAPNPALKRKPLQGLAPGLGAPRTVNIAGTDVTFRPQVVPPLAPGLGANG